MIAVSFSSGFPRALCGKLWSGSLVWATPQGGQARAQVRPLCPVSYCTGGPAFRPCVRFLPRENGSPGGEADTARKQVLSPVPPPPSLQAVQVSADC